MKVIRNILLVIIAIFGFQSISNAQGIEFTTHIGFGWGLTNSNGGAELGFGFRFGVAQDLAVGAQLGFLSVSSGVGGVNLNINVAYALSNFRFYAGPEIVFGNTGGFGLVGGIDWYFTEFLGIYAKTHLLFRPNGVVSTFLIGILLPPEVFSWILGLF
jgi:hypothetical protein